MGKDARNENLDLSFGEREQFDGLVSLLAKLGFGEQGPPRDTTFAEIEKFGHQAGRMVARAVDARLAEQHAEHFAGEEPCPACNEKRPTEQSPHELPLQTSDGEVTLHEPTCRCPTCRRDFFPSADRAQA
jgi:hypothetical protein